MAATCLPGHNHQPEWIYFCDQPPGGSSLLRSSTQRGRWGGQAKAERIGTTWASSAPPRPHCRIINDWLWWLWLEYQQHSAYFPLNYHWIQIQSLHYFVCLMRLRLVGDFVWLLKLPAQNKKLSNGENVQNSEQLEQPMKSFRKGIKGKPYHINTQILQVSTARAKANFRAS